MSNDDSFHDLIVENLKLGKKEHVADERTMMLEDFMRADAPPPPAFHDFDKYRRPFPLRINGNGDWGNCVKCAQTNQLLRLERVETKRSPGITAAMVVEEYKDESERQFGKRPVTPGDANDIGLVVLWNLRNWRSLGWTMQFGKRTKTYKIAAFGEIDPKNHQQMRQACHLLFGVQLGIWLPISAQAQTGPERMWDVTEGPGTEHGSWGGHAVYAKKYGPDEWEVLTWGFRQRVSNAFMDKYCDEAWGVVDSLDNWRVQQGIDVEAMRDKLRQITTQTEG